MKNLTLTLLLICVIGIGNINAQWTELVPVNSAAFTNIKCLDGHTCVLTGMDNGLIRKTTDGGLTWIDIGNGIPNANGLFDLQLLDENNWFVYGINIYMTINGGIMWNTTSYPDDIINAKGCFVSQGIGYIIGYSNNDVSWNVYKTIDSGANWNMVADPAMGIISFHDIYFINDSIGFISITKNATQTSHIYKTVDGGQTWNEKHQESNTNVIKELKFPTTEIGYGCGFGGTILKTLDSGENWTVITNPGGSNYSDLDFINETNGYVVGTAGKIIKTIDGGANWIQENHMTYAYGGVAIGNLDTVYVSTVADIVIINTQAGLSANVISLEKNETIGSIYPNPSVDKMNIVLNDIFVKREFKLFDLLGNEMSTINLISKITVLEKGNLSTGTYIYKILENNELVSNGKLTFN